MSSNDSNQHAWYKVVTPNGAYFTPSARARDKYFYIGDGTKIPSPKEVVEVLQNQLNPTYCVGDGLYFRQEDGELPLEQPSALPSGVYLYRQGDYGTPERLVPTALRTDAYVPLSGINEEIQNHAKDFLKNETIYRRCGLHKLGILLYGPPGNGKTTAIRNIINNIVTDDAIVVFLMAIPSEEFLAKMKHTLNDRLKIFVFEELAAAIKEVRMEPILNFLDGEQSLNKTIVFATTNYPERLPGNLVDRPSRFDALYEVGNPTAEDRKSLLAHYLNRPVTEDEVSLTKDMSIAALKESVFYSQLKAISLVDSIKRMKKQSQVAKKAFAKSSPLGLTSGDD